MTAAGIIDIASGIALAILAAALLLSLVRIVLGPTLGDRILALDLLTLVAMGLVGTIAIRTGSWLFIDIALALALLGFLATVALARYMLMRHRQQAAEEER
jgi:multicomponent Na+:H+ antiporter subunit F